ncbi:MAG: hypothetical protein KDB26_06185 [Microthrixaceae bacterium]|nr:hypothetical protein [Microthrixaceae bacterium]
MSWLPLFAIRRFIHVLAASIWVGGQLVMVGLIPMMRAKGGDIATAAGKAYNRLAWPAFAVLIASGIWNILSYSMQSLNITILSVKLVLVFFSGVGAASHQIVAAHQEPFRGRTAILAAGATMSTVFAVVAMYLGLIVTTVF